MKDNKSWILVKII